MKARNERIVEYITKLVVEQGLDTICIVEDLQNLADVLEPEAAEYLRDHALRVYDLKL